MRQLKIGKTVHRVVGAALALSMACVLTGCEKTGSGKYPEFDQYSFDQLAEYAIALRQDDEQVREQYNKLNELYKQSSGGSAPTSAISETGDGTGRFTFNSVDSKIIFPSTFEYPNSMRATGESSVKITDKVSIVPGQNWMFKIVNQTLDVESITGVSGTIKVGIQPSALTGDEIKNQVLAPWFEHIPAESINYSDIIINEGRYGAQAVTPTLISSEDAQLRCGMFAYGQTCVTYVFVYRGEKDITKDESITNFLNTVVIEEQTVRVEQ